MDSINYPLNKKKMKKKFKTLVTIIAVRFNESVHQGSCPSIDYNVILPGICRPTKP